MIPLFDLSATTRQLRKEIDEAIGRVLNSGVVIGGPEVAAFETELAIACGARYAIGCSSGTDALLALYMASGLASGDEVVTTPLTFFATAGGAARLGCRLVFADIDPATLTLNPRAAETVTTTRTAAVVTVDLFGHPAAAPHIECPVLEDAAHRGGPPLPRGHAAAMSFFPTKILGALGDAGAVLTNDRELADRVALLRSHGAHPKYHHVAVGGNFRLDALQAAILRVKLRTLRDAVAARRELAASYRRMFAASNVPDEMVLPADDPEHCYAQFVIRAPKRDALRVALERAEIQTAVYYPEPLHLAPCFSNLGYKRGSLPEAERAATEVLALPFYPGLTESAQLQVVAAIDSFYA